MSLIQDIFHSCISHMQYVLCHSRPKKPLLCLVCCHTTAAMYAAPQPHAAPPFAVDLGYDMNFLLALIIDDRA